MAAAKEGASSVVEILIKAKAQLDARGGEDGCTAFHFACAAGNTHCVELLVRAGCDTGLGTSRGGYTGLQMAQQLEHAGVIAVLESAPPLEDLAPEPAPAPAGPQKPNALCACDSGKKHKKCCKVAVDAARAKAATAKKDRVNVLKGGAGGDEVG
jgi:hypothetical protein